MPKHNVTLNIPGFTIKKTYGYDPIIHEVTYHRKARCPHCNSRNLRSKDSYVRDIGHETVGLRRVLLRLRVKKYHCRGCSKYFRERFEGILPWQRMTERLKIQLYRLHTQGVSRKDLSRSLGCSDGTVSRCYAYVYGLQDKKRLSMRCPEVLGIDEHRFSRKGGYATTLCDLKKHRVFDVAQGKSASSLKEYLDGLEGKDRVRIVCIDLSSSYRSLVKKYFPNARIVADRFHVIRLVLHHLVKTCQEIDPALKYSRGMAKLLRKHNAGLTKKQQHHLTAYLNAHPAINAIYQFKENMMELLLRKQQTKKQCQVHIVKFLDAIKTLKQTPFQSSRVLANTLEDWSEEIVRMWRFSKSNGITEGFHRKMKLIQRRAFGFKNFQNYRMRVRVLCAL